MGRGRPGGGEAAGRPPRQRVRGNAVGSQKICNG